MPDFPAPMSFDQFTTILERLRQMDAAILRLEDATTRRLEDHETRLRRQETLGVVGVTAIVLTIVVVGVVLAIVLRNSGNTP